MSIPTKRVNEIKHCPYPAARNEHEGVARRLLERNDVNPDNAGVWNQTLPLLAVMEGRKEATRMLL